MLRYERVYICAGRHKGKTALYLRGDGVHPTRRWVRLEDGREVRVLASSLAGEVPTR